MKFRTMKLRTSTLISAMTLFAAMAISVRSSAQQLQTDGIARPNASHPGKGIFQGAQAVVNRGAAYTADGSSVSPHIVTFDVKVV